MTGRNPWVVLCVAEDAPYHEVQSAFRRRVKQTHPDRGGDAAEFATVVRSFETLRQAVPAARPSPRRPTPYDHWLRPGRLTGSRIDDGGSAPVAFCRSDIGWATPALHNAASDFTTIFQSEMSRARAAAAN